MRRPAVGRPSRFSPTPMRQNFVAGNWKMNLTLPEARTLTTDIVRLLADELPGARPAARACARPFRCYWLWPRH
ncbi:MAG: hypothetical protein WKG07_01740 [Hymenobacter sp.]